MHNINWL